MLNFDQGIPISQWKKKNYFPDWVLILSISNRTPEEVLAAKGVKPTLSPNLNTLALVEVLSATFISFKNVSIKFYITLIP